MTIVSGVVVFQIIWWTLFFMSLPIGVVRDEEGVRGQDAGAPKKTYLKKKLLYVTVVSLALFAGAWWVIEQGFFSFRRIVAQESQGATNNFTDEQRSSQAVAYPAHEF